MSSEIFGFAFLYASQLFRYIEFFEGSFVEEASGWKGKLFSTGGKRGSHKGSCPDDLVLYDELLSALTRLDS